MMSEQVESRVPVEEVKSGVRLNGRIAHPPPSHSPVARARIPYLLSIPQPKAVPRSTNRLLVQVKRRFPEKGPYMT